MLNKQGLFSQNERYRREGMSPGMSVTPPAATPPTELPRDAVRADVDAAAAKAKVEEQAGSRLIVGPDIKLKGAEITDCDTLVVEGSVEASMDARVIQIAENGAYHGTVGVDMADIRGRFDGEMTARKTLIIRAGGKVSGKIRYGKIVIEDGGEVSGDISALSATKQAPLSAPSPAPKSPPQQFN